MIVIEIANRQKILKIDRRRFTRLAKYVLSEENREDAVLSVAFVGNDEMHQLNREFLSHDYPTDVITFPLSEPAGPLQGEIVIGAEYAIEVAESYGWEPADEASLYLVHGILHLCGYDDHAKSDARRMKRRQEELIAAFSDAELVRSKRGTNPQSGARSARVVASQAKQSGTPRSRRTSKRQ